MQLYMYLCVCAYAYIYSCTFAHVYMHMHYTHKMRIIRLDCFYIVQHACGALPSIMFDVLLDCMEPFDDVMHLISIVCMK